MEQVEENAQYLLDPSVEEDPTTSGSDLKVAVGSCKRNALSRERFVAGFVATKKSSHKISRNFPVRTELWVVLCLF